MKEDAAKSLLVEVLFSSPKEEAGVGLAVWFQDPAVNIHRMQIPEELRKVRQHQFFVMLLFLSRCLNDSQLFISF